MGHEERWPIEQPLSGPHRQLPRPNGRLVVRRYAADEVILPAQVPVSLMGFVQQGKVEVCTIRRGRRQVIRHLWPNQNLWNDFWNGFHAPVELRAAEPTILRLVALKGSEDSLFAAPPRAVTSRAMHDRRQLTWMAAFLSIFVLLGLLAWQWQAPWRSLLSRMAYVVASYQLENGEQGRALTVLQIGLDLDPSLARARNDLGYVLYQTGQRIEAQAAFELAQSADPTLSATCNNLALMLLESGDIGRARETLTQAVALDPENAIAWANLGLVERRLGHSEEAMHAYRASLRLNPDDLTSQTNLGVLCYEQQQLAEAQDHLQTALAADPDLPEAHLILGELALRQGERDKAWEHFQSAAVALDSNPVMHFYLALWYEQAKEWRKVERELARVLVLDPHPDLASLAQSHLDALARVRFGSSVGKREEKGK